ncbi:uncharacterized protein LOC135837476 [Planococcus citri]|uniref:uncharacterized protein LOC135837476 n=1 Tax=Planococcus citri TaxID=170843 RepID=UPI0031F9AB5F
MPVPEEKTSSHEEARRFLSQSFASMDDFIEAYKKSFLDKAKSKELYLLLLSELEKSVLEGNITNFKRLAKVVDYIGDVEGRTTLKTYSNDTENLPNLVISACKHNQVDILVYIFGSRKVFDSLSINVDDNHTVSPYEKDDSGHDAFYYAVRSGNAQLVDILISKWPGDYFAKRSDELDEVLARAYEELKLKNVTLSEEVEIFVENKLLSLRFFSNSSGQVRPSAKDVLSNIKERIDLVLDNIDLLKSEYLNGEKVDEKFLFVARFIAQNIHVLKRQLKLTYDRLPWEEIEFCLVSFVSSYMKQQEINLFYRAILTKTKMLDYLDSFAKKLEYDKAVIVDRPDYWTLAESRNLKRDQVVVEIVKNNPEFKELFDDYQQIRDIHSLETIGGYLNLALCADPKEREGQLIITRALQVIGEYLKNTLESPKLSNSTAERILSSLSEITQKVIIDLRNSLSHSSSLLKRTEIEENLDVGFFIGVQNDAKRICDVITEILYNNKIKMIEALLNRIIDSNHLDVVESIAEVLRYVEVDESNTDEFKMTELENLEKRIQELNDAIPMKTAHEEELFDKINVKMKLAENQSNNIRADYKTVFNVFRVTSEFLNENDLDANYIKSIKHASKEALKALVPPMESGSLKEIINLSYDILHSACSRMEGDDLDSVRRIQRELFYIADYRLTDIKSMEKLREKLCNKSSFLPVSRQKNPDNMTEEEFEKQLVSKLSELQNVLKNNLSSSALMQKLPSFKNNKKFQAVVEMLVLDIMSILGRSERHLENNLLFLDDNSPLLTGKCLRNHLAHGNVLLDVLLSDPSNALILNAEKLISENVVCSKRKVGKLIRDDPSKLKDRYDQSLFSIINQKKMFTALERGDVEDFKKYLQNGADINGRNIDSWTALHYAAAGPSLEAMRFILNQNSDLSAEVKNTDGQSPLHIAAARGQKHIAEFLLAEVHVPVDDRDKNNRTPLHMAAKNGHKDVVNVLLKFNADTNCKDRHSHSPLHYATQYNHIDVVQILLKKEPHPDYKQILGGYTLLHIAARNGSLEVVEYLLQKGANVNAKHDSNEIPLFEAARNGHLEVVKLLILKGSQVNTRVLNGSAPLHMAAVNGHKEVVEVLLTNGADLNIACKTFLNTPLHHATKEGHLEVIKVLMTYKANPNVSTSVGLTPLHLAAEHGYSEIVTYLIKHGANVDAREKNMSTPMHYAIYAGHKNIVEILIANKADVNAKSDDGLTFLHKAALRGHVDIVDVLIKNNANVNSPAANGGTPLLPAAQNGNVEVIELLLRNKAKMNVKTTDGMTALHIAAACGNTDAVAVLLKHKVDVNCKNNLRITPLHAAAQHGFKDIVDLLIKNNADIHATAVQPDEGKPGCFITASTLALAADAGHAEIVEMLLANGANINTKSIDGEPLLIRAASYNQKDIVRVLVSHGADVNVNRGRPLLYAVFYGHREIVEILLQNGARVNIKVDDEGHSILHPAAKRGIKEIAVALVNKGADVNAVNIENISPLYIAAQEGTDQVAEVLIANKANINAVNKHGTPLHRAAGHGHESMVALLLKNGAKTYIKNGWDRTPLEIAVICSQLRIVEMFLQHEKVDVNAKGGSNMTLLLLAMPESSLEMVKYLVSKGSDIHATDDRGSKPIHFAAKRGHKNMVEFFISKGLLVDETGASDFTSLHFAVMKDHLEVVKYLIGFGANVNARSVHGLTPMHFAAGLGLVDVAKVLVENGAAYNSVDNHSRRPWDMFDNKSAETKSTRSKNVVNALLSTEKLFEAVKSNCPSGVENFIKSGAFVNAKNTDTETTPLHYAAWKGCDKIVGILIQHKANTNAVCSQGFTPLHYAAKFSHLKCVKILLLHGAIYNAASNNGKTPANFTTDKNIVNLFKLIEDSFEKIKSVDCRIIDDLNRVKDTETLKAVMNARNRENKSLIAAAPPSLANKLKEVQIGDVSGGIDVASALLGGGFLEEGHALLENLYEKRERVLGSDNPGTLDVRKNLAQALYKQGNYQGALDILEEVLAKQKDLLGWNHQSTMDTRSFLAWVLFKQEKIQQAYDIFQEVLPKQEELLGFNHTDTETTRGQMAGVLERMDRNEEALDIYKSVYESRRKKYGEHSLNTISIRNNIAVILDKLGKYEESLKIYEEVFEKKKSILGMHNADTLRTLQCMAATLCQQKKYEESLKMYREVLDYQKKSLPPNHPEIFNTQNMLGHALLAQGKRISAFKVFKECLDQFQHVLGPNHPTILKILQKIELINLAFKYEGSNASEMLMYLQTDINVAASKGDLRTVERLLQDGADVSDKDIEGRTPLHFAVSGGHVEVVNVLLRNEADVTATTNKGNTPLHMAASKGHKEIVEILLKQVERDQLNEFINAKTTSAGATSLHVAAKSGFVEIAKCLLKHGAIYDAKNKEGKTPIDLSTDEKIVKLLKLIEEMFEGAKKGSVEIINKLKALQPDDFSAVTNTRNAQNRGLMQVAIVNKHKIIANELLKMLKKN